MLDTLRFVQGAVAKKDYVPALTHFQIANGRITGYNGRISISSPIALDLNVTPRALELVKAISTCRHEVAMHVTENGRLGIKSGPFKAFIDCTTEEFPAVAPSGDVVAIRPDLLDAMRVLSAFTAEDATRRWAMGILFRGPSAYATNNVVAVEYWLGYHFPCEIVVPSTTVNELLRIGEPPLQMQVNDKNVTFHYSGGRWLHSQLFDTTWPNTAKIFDRPCNPKEPPAGLYDAMRDVKPFLDKQSRIYLQPGHIGTTPASDIGADVDVPELQDYGCYNLDQFLLLENVAKKIDLSLYPTPALFFGDNIRGAIAGIRE